MKVRTYRPSRAPRYKLAHWPWWRAFIANSITGTRRAKARGCKRIDNDHERTRDWTIVRSHGAPSTFWLPKGDRIKHHAWAELAQLRREFKGDVYWLTQADVGFIQNSRAGLGEEAEIKDWLPARQEDLEDVFLDWMTAARQAWGPTWQHQLTIKVLTNLPGGLDYALMVCRAAHSVGIPTMLLVRGRDRFRTFEGFPEVTYVRGSLVLR
ncbi:MAG: hypothetical protein JWQ32_2055 [Marmoricola sp.]|nr:hypothetical protein [Marmoricola sp.]